MDRTVTVYIKTALDQQSVADLEQQLKQRIDQIVVGQKAKLTAALKQLIDEAVNEIIQKNTG